MLLAALELAAETSWLLLKTAWRTGRWLWGGSLAPDPVEQELQELRKRVQQLETKLITDSVR
jgi:hypothetical protein